MKKGDKWVLYGTKRWITNGSMADLAVVWGKVDDVVNGFIVGRMGDHGEGMIEFNRHEADQLIYDCIYHLSRKPE